MSNPTHVFSIAEREQLKEYVYEGIIPREKRATFWVKCSGLTAFKDNYCPHYYQSLVQADAKEWEQYPNKHFLQVDKDLNRTYPDDLFFTN